MLQLSILHRKVVLYFIKVNYFSFFFNYIFESKCVHQYIKSVFIGFVHLGVTCHITNILKLGINKDYKELFVWNMGCDALFHFSLFSILYVWLMRIFWSFGMQINKHWVSNIWTLYISYYTCVVNIYMYFIFLTCESISIFLHK